MDGETNLASVSSNTESVFSEKAQTPISHSSSKPATFLNQLLARVMTKEGLFIAMVFILAFIVRATLMRFELFFEFDSYWHARMVSYILQGLPAPSVDPLAYYQSISGATFANPPLFFWYVSAAIYKIFTLNGAYNFETWVLWVKLLPALYGALICVAMYFLGKELFKGTHEKAAGLFAGILAAIVPSFVYRTMGGFFEDDSFGFLWMIIGFVFFVRAMRNPQLTKQKMLDALFAGIGFGLMVMSWSGYNQLLPILLGIGFVQFWVWLQEGEMEHAKAYAGLWMISFVTFALFAFVVTGTGFLSQFGTIIGQLLFKTEFFWYHTLIIILILFAICAAAWKYRQMNPTDGAKAIKGIYTIIILALVLAPLLVMMFNISFRTGDVLGQTIGEESDGRNYFGNKYSMLALFALVGVPAMGFLLLRKSRRFEQLALPLVWLIVTFFMAWGKLKFTYYWGLPLALTGMVVLILAMMWMEKRSASTQKIVVAAMGFMLLCGIGAGIVFVTQNTPNIESTPGWKDALFWSQTNLPSDTKFMNWWDEGHWISFLTGKKVLIDNRNADGKATSDVAKFLLSSSTTEAENIVAKYGSTHLIFGNDLLGKLTSMGFYAYGTANDPRVQGMVGFVNRCTTQNSPLTNELSYNCGGNNLTPAQYDALPTTWQSTANNLQNGVPFFIYRDIHKKWIYAFSASGNQTMIARLWLGQPDAKAAFTEVYRNDGDVRIFQVAAPVIVPMDTNTSTSPDSNVSTSETDANASA